MFPEDDSNMIHNNFDFKQKHKNKLGLRKRIYEFYTAPITKFWFYAVSYFYRLLKFIIPRITRRKTNLFFFSCKSLKFSQKFIYISIAFLSNVPAHLQSRDSN